MGEKSTSFFNVNHGNEKRTMEFFENGKKDHIFWLCVEDEDREDCVKGLCFIWDLDRSMPKFGIAVRDNCHHRGIGTALIEYVKEYCRENGYGGLFLTTAVTNFNAQRLYEKCGFDKMGYSTDGEGEYIYINRFFRG